jgi:hypothetical protein
MFFRNFWICSGKFLLGLDFLVLLYQVEDLVLRGRNEVEAPFNGIGAKQKSACGGQEGHEKLFDIFMTTLQIYSTILYLKES